MKRKIIEIDEALCNGCGNCITGCAEGALQIVDGKAKMVKEQFCDGFGDCIGTCPTGALKFGEESELKDLIEKAEPFRPELGIKTRVHYLNLPRKFVAGTLYDPVEKEVIIGATCTLTDSGSGETFTVETNNFGDFWFRNLDDDRPFSLKLEKDGNIKVFGDIVTEKDVNLGDIPLT